MNINTGNNFQSAYGNYRIFGNKKENKSIAGAGKGNRNGADKLIDNIREIIEKKREQISELSSNENMSDKMKAMRKEDLENQIEQLEQQINEIMLEEQKKQVEEAVQQKKEKYDNGKTNEEIFTEMTIKASISLQSAQKFRLLKAEKEREAVRISQEMENDSKMGIHSQNSADRLAEVKSAVSSIDKVINEKTGDAQKAVKEYEEEVEKQAEKADYEKTEEQKAEEEKEKNIQSIEKNEGSIVK